MMTAFDPSHYIAAWRASPFGHLDQEPWIVVRDIEAIVRHAAQRVADDYVHTGEFAIHRTAIIEDGVVLKGPGIIDAGCFVAAGSYLRGGTYLGAGCIIGPCSELKSSLMFPGSKIAHLNFVGDSIIGSRVNIEAGAIVANYRNELDDKAIRIRIGEDVIETGVDKFGALIGDDARIGANAVVAPGAVIAPGAKVGRLQLHDQYPY